MQSSAFRLALLVFLLIPLDSLAQSATLRGFVREAASGQPIAGANVVLRGIDQDAFLGSATNADGVYAVSSIDPGRYALKVSYISFETIEDTIRLDPGELLNRNFSLRLADTELDEVVVESERESAGAASVVAGLQTVKAAEIDQIPTPDVSGDLASYVSTLPGVVSTGDRGGQLFVRGGEPTQNLVLVDGVPIYQPFHLIGFYSAFPSAIISSSDIYAGGFGARYGGRLSSVMDISTREGNKKSYEALATVAPFVTSALVEGPIITDRLSILASYRQSVIEQGASRIVDQPLPYSFDDQYVKLHGNLTENSRLSLMGLRSFDRGKLTAQIAEQESDRDDQEIEWLNEAVGARYLFLPSTLPVLAEIVISRTRIRNAFGPADDPSRSSETVQYQGKADIKYFVGGTSVNWGFLVRSLQLESDLGGQFRNVESDLNYATEAAAYLETDLDLPAGIRLQPGLRVQSFPSQGQAYLEPRLRAVWTLSNQHRLSLAGGMYHQQVVGLSDRRDAGNVFTAWTTAPFGDVPQAAQVIAGYRYTPTTWLEFSVEGYYKKLSNLLVAEWTPSPRFSTDLQNADGRSLGADIRLELSTEPVYAFLSYAYANTEYDARGTAIPYWFGERSKTYAPPHDRRHQINSLVSFSLYDFDLSLRWQFGSGLPFTQALGFDRFIFMDGPTDVTEEGGEQRVIYADPYNARLPSYHRFDVSLERTWRVGSHVDVTTQASVINGYDRNNLFYLDLYTLQRVDQLPFVPSFGLKVALH